MKNNAHWILQVATLAAGLAISVGCAPLGGGTDLEQKVAQQDMQLRQMQPQQADTWNQLQAMRQEVNELKAQLAALNGAGGAEEIAARVRQHDAALRQMDTNMALNLELGEPIPVGVAPASSITLTGAPESSLYGGVAPAALPAVSAAADSYGLPQETTTVQHVTAPSEDTWGKADPQPQEMTPQKDISLALLDAGLNAFNARNYDSAERSFSDFLKNYPNHSQTADAMYYLAECDFQRNRFSEAAIAYDDVITKFPSSSVAPGAYLKQALSFSKLNNSEAAKARMRELVAKFPQSPEAARARSFLKTNS